MRISDWSSDVCSSDLAGLTLRELAARVELSPSFLSQVERDITRPRLATLQRIAEAFDTSMHALLGAADPSPQVSVVRAGEGLRLLHDGDPAHGEVRALVHHGREIEAIEVTGAPPDFAEPYAHPGVELLYVVSGEVEVEVEGQVHRLGRGDSISYRAQAPHRTRRLGGEVKLLIVNAPQQ